MRVLTLALTLSATLVAGEPSRPNVVVILADDMGLGDVGAYGRSGKTRTPHLDRLAAEGVRFTDAHSNSAVSTPTRYGLLTGRYAFRSRLTQGVLAGYDAPLIEVGRPTLASLLKGVGYRTAVIGKWHLGLGWVKRDPARPLTQGDPWSGLDAANVDHATPLTATPLELGFDESQVLPASLDTPPYLWVNGRRVEGGAEVAPVPTWIDRGARGRWYHGGPTGPGFVHGAVGADIAARAERWIAAQGTRPFFLYLPLTLPHTPWLPDGTGRTGFHYGDAVAETDDTVGRVMAALKAQGLDRDTLMVFLADNGAYWFEEDRAATGHDAHGGLRGRKGDLYEGGHRVPFLVRWPARVAPGQVRSDLVGTTDLMATLADLVGRPLGAGGEDSFSFKAALGLRSREPRRQDLVLHSLEGFFALRSGPHVLIDHPGGGGWARPEPGAPAVQLFDLAADPAQTRNLAEERPELVRDLQARLHVLRALGRSR